MLAKLDHLLNWGWTPQDQGIIRVRRVRTLVSAGLLLVLVAVPFLLRAIDWNITWRMISISFAIGLAALGLALLYLFHTISVYCISAHLIILALFTGAVGGVISSGGSGSVNQVWLLLVPLLAGIIVGLRSALIWGAVILVFVVVLAYLESHGWAFPNQTPVGFRDSQNLLQMVGVLLALLGLIYSFLGHLGYSEQMLAEQNRQLQQRIAEKVIAEREAREAEKTKTRFLCNMSHEMRTPLNAVIGFSARLQKSLDGRLDAREALALERVGASGRRMLQLVDDLFVLSAIDSGSFELNRCEVDPDQLLQAVYQAQQAEAAERDLLLAVEYQGASSLFADPGRLGQALNTLVHYALCTTPQGGVRVTAFNTSENEVCLQIEDNAPAMTEEMQARLFDRYNHLHSVGEGGTDQAGLGLALAGELVFQHGGRIAIMSTDQGNRYRIQLPSGYERG